MKSALNFLSLLFTVLILTNTAYAESPREQLKQMVGQLQANPDDDALREKIIKFAQKLKPAPAIPEEAERRMVRGTAAFKGAKSIADYQKAAQEFEQATLAAPWYGDAYFNLGVAQDKAEEYEDALSSLKLALLALPNSKDIKALIYEVEYRNEKESDPYEQRQKELGQKQQKFSALIQKLDGAVFFGSYREKGVLTNYEIRFHKGGENNYLVCSARHKTIQSDNPESPVMFQWKDDGERSVWPTSDFEFGGCTFLGQYKLSSDSKTLESLFDNEHIYMTYSRQ